MRIFAADEKALVPVTVRRTPQERAGGWSKIFHDRCIKILVVVWRVGRYGQFGDGRYSLGRDGVESIGAGCVRKLIDEWSGNGSHVRWRLPEFYAQEMINIPEHSN